MYWKDYGIKLRCKNDWSVNDNNGRDFDIIYNKIKVEIIKYQFRVENICARTVTLDLMHLQLHRICDLHRMQNQ